MTLIAQLRAWDDSDMWDHQPTPEEALRQLVYCCVHAFIEEHPESVVAYLQSDDDEVPGLSTWVDEYANRP